MKNESKSSTLLNNYKLINCRGKLLDLSTPVIMGILNVTPDSFYDGGKFTEQKAIIEQAGKLLSQGADIIDVGAMTSRPGSPLITETTELKRIIPAINGIMDKYPDAIISVDTVRSEVAGKCIEAGASIINDISGGDLDENMFKTVSLLNVPYILMHMKGTPENMQENPQYDDVVSEVAASLGSKIAELRNAGVHDIIIDPGFGFGKTTDHNYQLLGALDYFNFLECPVLAGVSRKSMICKVLKVNPEQALNGTTALNMVALLKGASILRVHDVSEAIEVVKLFVSLRDSGSN
jgi:dihydropteroate synthase